MEEKLRELLAKQAVIDTIIRLFIRTDERDWVAVQDCLAPEVLFNMTAATGGEPVTLSSQEIVHGWQQGLINLEAVHHQASNYVVSVRDGEADAFCYAIASHYRNTRSGSNSRIFVGSYDFHLVDADGAWKIDRFDFHLKYIDGNKNLDAEP